MTAFLELAFIYNITITLNILENIFCSNKTLNLSYFLILLNWPFTPFAVVFTPGTPVLPTSTSARQRYIPNITHDESKDLDTIIAGRKFNKVHITHPEHILFFCFFCFFYGPPVH